MTETAKERIYREAKKRINMRKNGIHPSDYFEGWVVDYIDSSTTDKLSVEKLQEQLNITKKALTEIYLDVNETIIDPVFLFHQSQRIAGRALNELGENNEI